MVSAIYSGQTYYYNLNEKMNVDQITNFDYYFNEDESLTELEGINVSLNNLIVEIEINPLFVGIFNITYVVNGNKIVPNPVVSTGGGGSSNRYYKNWNCSNWSECDGYFQMRKCELFKDENIKEDQEKPKEWKLCYVEPSEEIILNEKNQEEKDPKEPETLENSEKVWKIYTGLLFSILFVIFLYILLRIVVNYYRKKKVKNGFEKGVE